MAIITGVLGGLFAKLALILIGKFITQQKIKVLAVALLLGSIIGLFNYLSLGQIAGSGKDEVLLMLNAEALNISGIDFIWMKYLAVKFHHVVPYFQKPHSETYQAF